MNIALLHPCFIMFLDCRSSLDNVPLFFFFRMAEALCAYIERDRPFLGICLGLQLLFETSEENGPGECSRPFF